MNAHSSDYELMQRVASGDAAAYRQLSTSHLGAIVTYAFRLTKNHAEAEEIAQETFLRAWQNAGRYEPQARVSTWLHRIAHNLALDLLRKRRGESYELDDERDAAPCPISPRGSSRRRRARCRCKPRSTRCPSGSAWPWCSATSRASPTPKSPSSSTLASRRWSPSSLAVDADSVNF